jgi:hypothetical protein
MQPDGIAICLASLRIADDPSEAEMSGAVQKAHCALAVDASSHREDLLSVPSLSAITKSHAWIDKT